MGIDDEIEIIEPLDADVLKWPRRLLGALYVVVALWSCFQIYAYEMYQEELVIRLIFIGFCLPLTGFVIAGHKWAMSSAYAVLLCYFGAFYLLLELRVSIGLIGLVLFLGILTLRAMKATDQESRISQMPDAEVFE